MGVGAWLGVPQRRRRTVAAALARLVDPDEAAREAATFELFDHAARLDDEDRVRVEAALRRLVVADPALTVRFVAVLALDQLGHRDEPGPVLDVLRTGGPNLHVAATTAAWFPSPDMVDALVTRLDDANDLVVQATAESLAAIGDARAVPALEAVVRSAQRRSDRRAASAALARLRTGGA